MLLILRKLKRSVFANGQFRNYLLYALGEMVLVVIGILIALKIDNWNSENKRQETLESYLRSIAGNIAKDVEAASAVRARREETYELSLRNLLVSRKSSFDVTEIAFASHALEQAQKLHYFNANTSGYEALKSSGNLDQMQGRDIESLLYDYYDTVDRIAQAEQSYNDYVRQLWLQIVTDWPRNLANFEFTDPSVLTPDRFQALQPDFEELLEKSSMVAIHNNTQSIGPLLYDYERLFALGRTFIRMVEKGAMDFDDSTLRDLERIYDPNSGIGYSNLVTDGQVSWHTYTAIYADSNVAGTVGGSRDLAESDLAQNRGFNFQSFQQSDGGLHIVYPGGTEWAAISFIVSNSSQSRPYLDFSEFEKIRLEIKGDLGGEKILVNLKDNTDPDDGSQTNIELQLTDQWQKYEIDLADFKTADLSHLHVPLAFLLLEGAQSFSVRTVQYIDSE